jgi:hypothetical protein
VKNFKEFAYGTDEENLSSNGMFLSHEDVIETAIDELDLEEDQTLYVSRIEKWNPIFTIDDLESHLNENAYDECGEPAADYPIISKNIREKYRLKFQNLVEEYLKESGEYDRLYKCFDSKSFEITKGMIAKSINSSNEQKEKE